MVSLVVKMGREVKIFENIVIEYKEKLGFFW